MRTERSQSGVCELELRLYIAINITYYSLDWEITWLCLSCLKDIVNAVSDGWLYSGITYLIKCYYGGLGFQIK